jgi:tRNA G18 (ribose-2'-O)-methylase SpoU
MEIEKLSLSTLNRISIEDYKKVKKLDYDVVADNIRSGQNVGAFFRTADCFSADNVYLSGITPTPPNKEILKTALGATESVKWSYFDDNESLILYLKKNNIKIIVLEQTNHSVLLQHFVPEVGQKYALVFGNEVDGVSETFIKSADLCVEIPQIGTKHSLNVSVCAGIVMWHMYNYLKTT